jgi:soluble epoxide hydrolase/lipid-phosphate phosphatase
LTNDFIEILDVEHVEKVISSGHGWGAGMAQRFYNYHPELCAGLITLNVPVSPRPEVPIVLDKLAPMTIKLLGYFLGWYWYVFSDLVDGPTLLGQHIESLFTGLHAEPAAWMDTLCTQDGLRKWLEQDKKGPVQAYVTEAMREDFIMRMRRDGFPASLCYYRALVKGLMYEQDKEVPVERYKVNVPYLLWQTYWTSSVGRKRIERAMALGLTSKFDNEGSGCRPLVYAREAERDWGDFREVVRGYLLNLCSPDYCSIWYIMNL